MPLYDCLIIGGGPAGLSTALGLCRAIRSCVIFDDGLYRNWATSYMHTVPTWDHVRPDEYREKATTELLSGRYNTVSEISTSPILSVVQKTIPTGHDHRSNVTSDSNIPSSSTKKKSSKRERKVFVATDKNGVEWYGRTIVFASGVEDILPSGENIPGFAEGWGQSIFHCLFCHGFEERHSPSAGVLILVPGAFQFSPAFAGMASKLAKKITIYTNGWDLHEEIARLTAAENESTTSNSHTNTNNKNSNSSQSPNHEHLIKNDTAHAHKNTLGSLSVADLKAIEGLLLRNGFEIDNRPIQRLVPYKTNIDRSCEDDPPSIDIHFKDGSMANHSFLICRPDQQVRNRKMMEKLGVKFNPHSGLAEVTSSMNATHVPGVFVAGDNNTMFQQIVNAFCQGGTVAGGVHHFLLTKELNHEVY